MAKKKNNNNNNNIDKDIKQIIETENRLTENMIEIDKGIKKGDKKYMAVYGEGWKE